MTSVPQQPPSMAKVGGSALAVNQSSAGAGTSGLLGFVGLFALAAVFFITEFYFVAMLIISIALLIYVTGSEIGKIVMSSVTIFFSSRHLTARAAQLQDDLVALRSALQLERDAQGEIQVGPMSEGTVVKLPDNPLSRDIKTVVEFEKSYEYAEYVVHSYYVECHELYDQTSAHFDFVSGAMPLFGLIGTIVGLIAMFDSLGGDVTVEALAPQLALALKTTLYGAIFSSLYRIVGSRFDQRLRALDYDYEIFSRALQVIVDNKARVEVYR